MNKENNRLSEIRISGIKPQLHEELMNISNNLGVTVTSLIKPKIQEFVNSYPPDLKRPKAQFPSKA